MTTYLILGATGKTGRRVAARLAAAGHTVRAAARTPGPAAERVEPIRFDWDDPATHDPALAGVAGVYVVAPALRLDYADAVAALLERAAAAGVQRAVLLSARGADAAAERALADSGTVLRPTGFAQNFTEGAFVPDAEGRILAPTGSGRSPFIDVDDIAAVAAAALTEDGHAGETYELSGPEALTFAEAAAILGEASGRRLAHVDVPMEGWVAGLTDHGVPADFARHLAEMFGAIRDGHQAHLSDGVRRALGREPTSFADWAARAAG